MLTAKERQLANRILLGEALVNERKRKGLSQQAVAELTHVSRVTISYYEHGHRSINLEDFLTMCDVCGFDSQDILRDLQSASDKDLEKALLRYKKTRKTVQPVDGLPRNIDRKE